MIVPLTIDDVLSLFDEKIVAARWLETNGSRLDKEVAKSTRHALESVRRNLISKIETEGKRREDLRQGQLRLVG